MHYGITDT
jgi:hypothetical protein